MLNNEPFIYYAADDYGMTAETCDRIEDCKRNGCLNKIAVLPNSAVTDLRERLANSDLMLSVHINLVEGKSITSPEQIPLLTDKDGYFKHSFFGLLCLSLSQHRRAFAKQVGMEIDAQIQKAKTLLPPDTPLRLDSHQHVCMIPTIFKELMHIIDEQHLQIAYLRIPDEPLLPYLAEPSLYLTYSPINLLKQWVLKLCSLTNKKELKKRNIPSAYFFGILLSGNMDTHRVSKILPHYCKLAKKHGRKIEILFHPGYTNRGEPLFDIRKKEFHKFYFSEGRKNEYDAMHKLTAQTTKF